MRRVRRQDAPALAQARSGLCSGHRPVPRLHPHHAAAPAARLAPQLLKGGRTRCSSFPAPCIRQFGTYYLQSALVPEETLWHARFFSLRPPPQSYTLRSKLGEERLLPLVRVSARRLCRAFDAASLLSGWLTCALRRERERLAPRLRVGFKRAQKKLYPRGGGACPRAPRTAEPATTGRARASGCVRRRIEPCLCEAALLPARSKPGPAPAARARA